MPISASVMMSSQLPLAPEPCSSTGRYALRSMAANRPAFGQAGTVDLISSAAFAQPAPAQPVCNGALLLVCVFSVADQASMILIAASAYRLSRVTYQTSASPYAARASPRSSEQPLSGTEWEPQSTSARGVAAPDGDAEDRSALYADAHGCAPACTLPRMKSSCARSRSTPGWTKPLCADGPADADADAEADADPDGPAEPSSSADDPDAPAAQWVPAGRRAPGALVHTRASAPTVSSAPPAASQIRVPRFIVAKETCSTRQGQAPVQIASMVASSVRLIAASRSSSGKAASGPSAMSAARPCALDQATISV